MISAPGWLHYRSVGLRIGIFEIILGDGYAEEVLLGYL